MQLKFYDTSVNPAVNFELKIRSKMNQRAPEG